MPLRFTDDRPPVPPVDLVRRVVQPFPADHGAREQEAFDVHAPQQLAGLERALGIVGKEFADFERLLDFGCGPGRYARHLGPLSATTEIHGADIDADHIAWLRTNVPYGHFEVVPHEPPTAYPDGHFDLIINHSVFTHLPEALQDAWLGELQRISRPGAVLLLTTHSTTQWNVAASNIESGGTPVAPLRARLEQDGILFLADDHFIGSTHPDFYHTTFHAPWYVFERWTRWFDVAAFIPLGSHSQDLIVLRRRADGAAPERPIGHGTTEAAPAAAAPALADEVATHLAAARAAIAQRRVPQTLLGRLKRRALAREMARQERIDGHLADALAAIAARQPSANREVEMLRTGLYELGQRVTSVACELRAER